MDRRVTKWASTGAGHPGWSCKEHMEECKKKQNNKSLKMRHLKIKTINAGRWWQHGDLFWTENWCCIDYYLWALMKRPYGSDLDWTSWKWLLMSKGINANRRKTLRSNFFPPGEIDEALNGSGTAQWLNSRKPNNILIYWDQLQNSCFVVSTSTML